MLKAENSIVTAFDGYIAWRRWHKGKGEGAETQTYYTVENTPKTQIHRKTSLLFIEQCGWTSSNQTIKI